MLEPQVVYMTVSTSMPEINMCVSASMTEILVGVDTSISMGGLVEHYDGAYVVIPKADEDQVLATQYKVMDDNVTVQRVPYYETSNPDGVTVYIASEVN